MQSLVRARNLGSKAIRSLNSLASTVENRPTCHAARRRVTQTVLFETRLRAPAIKAEEDAFLPPSDPPATLTLGNPKNVTSAAPVAGS